jgi:hypothetical protein
MAQESSVTQVDMPSPESKDGPDRRRWLLLVGAAGLAAIYFGFLCFDPAQCQNLVRRSGYLWMVVLSLLWLFAAVRLFRREPHLVARAWPGWTHTLIILAAWLWLLRMDPFGYKVLFDEPVQVSTSLTLHTDRELASVVRAFTISDIFTVFTSHLDKRPPFFPFLVACLHDLTGYRLINAYIVNAAGTLALLVFVWHLGRKVAGGNEGGACFVGLLATLPTLGVTSTGAGMELINLTLIGLLAVTAFAYAESPTSDRLSVMVLSALLLAYTRYESVLYIATVGAVWLCVCCRERRIYSGWAWIMLPLALVLYGWHNTVLSNTPALWELRENQSDRFSLAYAANNLRHAGIFLFNTGRNISNSVLLTVLGLLGLGMAVVQLFRRRSSLSSSTWIVFLAIAAGVLVNFALLMCYYWGELDDPIVTRLSLPFHLLLAMFAVAGWKEWGNVKPSWGSWSFPLGAVGVALMLWTAPTIAHHRYTERDLMRDNYEWEREVVSTFWPPPGLVISSRSPVCWLAERIPSLSFERVHLRESGLKWHLGRHTFGTILVMQRVLTSGADGKWAVDSAHKVPATWKLREVAVRRFGMTLTRISELVSIDDPGNSPPNEHAVHAEMPESPPDLQEGGVRMPAAPSAIRTPRVAGQFPRWGLP